MRTLAVLLVALFALAVAIAALEQPSPATPSLAPYVKRSQLGGTGAAAIRLQAWKSIRDLERRSGMVVISEVLTAQRVTGDLAWLTYLVKVSRPDGTGVSSEYVLVTLNRSLWSVTQLAPGINPAASN